MARQRGKGSGSGLQQRRGTQKRSKVASVQVAGPPSSDSGKAQKGDSRACNMQYDGEKIPWVGYTVLAAVTAIAYIPTYTNDFVWDDRIFADAPQVQNFTGLYDIWFKPGTIKSEAHYWPMVYTSFWLDYRIWGRSPFMSHLTNVLFHATGSCLLHRLLRRIGQAQLAAWISAIVFALHPVHVESVAWAIERKDTLSSLFYLSSLLCHPFIGLAQVEPSNWTKRAAAVSLVLYALGLLTKSIVVSLPVVLLLLPWFMRGRVRRCEAIYSIPFFIAGLAIAVSDMIMMIGVDYVDFGYTLLERIMIASRAVCFYLFKIVCPADLVMIYPPWNVRQDRALWVVCVAVVAAGLIVLFVLRHRWGRGPIMGLLFFGVTISPCLCLIDYSYMQYSFVADRYQYLAMAGPIAVFSSMAANVLDAPRTKDPRMTLVGAGILVFAMGMQTYKQSSEYRDNATFFAYVTKHNPRGFHGWHHLGNEYINQERLSDAARCLKEAADIVEERRDDLQPHIYRLQGTVTYINYGMVLSKMGFDDEGIEQLEKAIALRPRNVQALNEMGNALSLAKRHEEAIEYFRRAVKVDPEYAFGWSNMGLEHARLQRWEDAIAPLQRAIELNPGLIKARTNLATVFVAQGKHQLAINQYGHILSRHPDDKVAMERLENSIQALEQFKKKKEEKQMERETQA